MDKAFQPLFAGLFRLIPSGAHPYIRVIRNRSALPITETELRLMAAAAMMGLKRMPKAG